MFRGLLAADSQLANLELVDPDILSDSSFSCAWQAGTTRLSDGDLEQKVHMKGARSRGVTWYTDDDLGHSICKGRRCNPVHSYVCCHGELIQLC